MPLTTFQEELAILLSVNRSEDSHLAGGAALNFEPNSFRYSQDLDYFHDSEKRVATAFQADRDLLLKNKFQCEIEMNQPGYIRCLVKKNKPKLNGHMILLGDLCLYKNIHAVAQFCIP